MEKRELSPGKGVVRTGETVRRPVRPWSGSVCRFQRFMEAGGLPVEAVMEMTGSAVVTAFCEGETNHPRAGPMRPCMRWGGCSRGFTGGLRRLKPGRGMCGSPGACGKSAAGSGCAAMGISRRGTC